MKIFMKNYQKALAFLVEEYKELLISACRFGFSYLYPSLCTLFTALPEGSF